MLKGIDILLGLSVVMLVVSMVVTVLTQFVTGVLNSRAKHLARGLGDLLQQVDPQLERAVAEQIARAVLRHPMICQLQNIPGLGTTLGSTIHREEFIKLLMDMAAGQCFGLDKNVFPDSTRDKLKGLLKSNGIADPASTLDNVRSYALLLEQAHPELASNARQNIALLQEANSRFLAKINSWFDQTIDRVSDRFTASTRVITVLCSLLVVATIQLDSIDLINRLALDDGLRETLVAKALAIDNGSTPAVTPSAAGKTPPDNPNLQALRSDLQSLDELGVINLFSLDKNGWWQHWHQLNPIGLLLSVVLVSLGAPFWYDSLKNLLRLRSVLSGKDDAQRRERQTTQVPEPNPAKTDATPPAPIPLAGERGILG